MDAIIGSSGSLIAVSDGLQADLKQQQQLIDENTARVTICKPGSRTRWPPRMR